MVQFFEIAFAQTGNLHDYVTISALADNGWLWIVCLLFCMPLRQRAEALLEHCTREGGLVRGSRELVTRLTLSAVLLILSVALLVGATNNAFIYTRF